MTGDQPRVAVITAASSGLGKAAAKALAAQADGADALIWLMTSDEGGENSGSSWYKRAPRLPDPLIDDADFIARFWAASGARVARIEA